MVFEFYAVILEKGGEIKLKNPYISWGTIKYQIIQWLIEKKKKEKKRKKKKRKKRKRRNLSRKSEKDGLDSNGGYLS